MASGGHDLEFVDPDISQDYECPICLLILKDPQMVSCCGRKYCMSCIGRVSASNKPCPFCKDSFDCMAEKQLNRRILDLKVKCSKSKIGCEWVGEVRQLEEHQTTSCAYIQVICSLGCGEYVQRCLLEQHELDQCSKRPMESRLFSLTQKLETRLQKMETKCEEQEVKIKKLEEEVCLLKDCNEKQNCELVSLNQLLKKVNDAHHNELTSSLKAVEGELIRRCFSFSISLTLRDSCWVGPSFLSHQNGYALQLSACMEKNQSVLKSLVFSVFHSGGRPDRYPITLSLDILPQQRNDNNIMWPVYVSVDVLVLSKTDLDANGKLVTVTCYKGSPSDMPLESHSSPEQDDADDDSDECIGHANNSFNCRLVIININYGPDPPTIEQDKMDFF